MSAKRRRRRTGNAAVCLGPHEAPTVLSRRAEFCPGSAAPASSSLSVGVFAAAVAPRMGRRRTVASAELWVGSQGRALPCPGAPSVVENDVVFGRRCARRRAGAKNGVRGQFNGPTTVGHAVLDAATAAGKHGAMGEGGSVHIYARVGRPLGACHQHPGRGDACDCGFCWK